MPLSEQDPMSLFVQRIGGRMHIRRSSIDYYVPCSMKIDMIMRLYDPDILRVYALDEY